MCVRQSMLEDLHRGLSPITKTGDYSDVVVVDAEGQRLPWPEISRFDEDEIRDLMRQIVNKIYTFLAKMDDPDFTAWRGIMSKSVTSGGPTGSRFGRIQRRNAWTCRLCRAAADCSKAISKFRPAMYSPIWPS